ncbi:MAG: hypothetical protein DHS20C01_17890 [marine bacterium B5-7]|nr:MAG: hypothetical protein DHS20C01_17890 [marine bacterium B5-7]
MKVGVVYVTIMFVMASVSGHASPPESEAAIEAAVKWVSKLPTEEMYGDGYRLIISPSPLVSETQQTIVPVVVLDYYNRAWQSFVMDNNLDTEQRELHHYEIGNELGDTDLIITIQGLLLPRIVDGQPQGIIRASVGPSMWFRYVLKSGKLINSKHMR